MDENNTLIGESLYQGEPNETKEKLKCLVILPSGRKGEYAYGIEESDFVYNYIIIPAIEVFKKQKDCDIKIVLQRNKDLSGVVTSDILEEIASADFCIVDITGSNPNILFELGIRYSLRSKTTILLGQSKGLLPFSTQGYRFLEYKCLKPQPALEGLTDYLISGYEEKRTDSLIYETFPDMEVNIPNKVKSIGEFSKVASWNDWLDKLKKLYSLLSYSYNNQSFVPDVIFGVSSGGLIVADLLGRELYKGIPVISLWADRWIQDMESFDRSCYYFDNPMNISTLDIYKKKISTNHILKILVVDDKLSSGQTMLQASTFFKRQLIENYEIVFAPLYIKNKEYPSIEQYLPFGFNNGKTFNISKKEYYKQIATDNNEITLPYHNIFTQSKIY